MLGGSVKRFTIAEYHRLTEMGFFAEDDRVELIRGQIIEMAAKGTAHEVCLTRLLRELTVLLLNQATLRCQSPLSLSPTSEPEPDISIVQNRADDYLTAHPSATDVLLVIEISDSSLKYDQDTKRSIYAEAQISHYWIFNLLDRWLESYCEPFGTGSEFGYRYRQILLPHETIALPHFSDLSINLAKVFPG
jgi:Uma2 family endonuclease